jgi:hypothetical protein
MKIKTTALLSAFITLFLASEVLGGWVTEEVTTYGEGARDTTISYVQKNKVMVVNSETMVFDFEKGMLYFLVREHKVYWSGTPEEWLQSMEEGQKQMEEAQLKKMTPEQREAYSQYTKQMNQEAEKPTPREEIEVEVKRTSEQATIAGYSGRKYQVWVDGKLKEELWVCAEIDPQDEIDLHKLEPQDEIDLHKLEEFTKAMGGLSEEGSYESSPEYMKIATYMEQGLVLRSVTYDEEGTREQVSETTRLENKNIPASEFNVPEGYKRLSTAEFVGLMMHN